MPKPEVSVVMSVYNGAAGLRKCMDSVLGQQGCELEVVVVNDGSTDDSPAILAEYALRDGRVRVLHQHNQGLTRALVEGCMHARGEFIARHDADDVSLPGRLQSQCAFLRSHPGAAAVAGLTRVLAPGGEWMYDIKPPARIEVDVRRDEVRLPPLCAATFRRTAYEACGGFRATFAVAQDIDLWLRLLDQGPCFGLPDPVYENVATAGGITSRRREEQVRFVALAMAAARLRRTGQDDKALLDHYQPPAGVIMRSDTHRARFFYFVGSCLRRHNPEAARRYFELATRENPLHLKARIRRLFT
jgi:glycosyltransferase involved in cell wall biosynthesis